MKSESASSGDAPAPRKLAQPGDVMWERNVAILAARGQEIAVVTSTGEELVGYLAGMDESALELCLTEGAVKVLVRLDHLVHLDETGHTLESAPMAETIIETVRTFQRVCAHHAERWIK